MEERYPFHIHYVLKANPSNWNRHKISYLILESLTEDYLNENNFAPSFINRSGDEPYDFIRLRRDFKEKVEVWVEVEVSDRGLSACICSKKPVPQKACEIVANSVLWSVWGSRITKDAKREIAGRVV